MMKRNILITGASSGIGKALALRYALPENHLILFARNTEKLHQVAALCEAKNGSVKTFSIDVSKTDALRALIDDIDSTTPIDLIICNAGVTSSIGKNGEAESWENICRVIDTNLYGVLASLNPLISNFQQRKHGQIAIISSLGAYRGMPITPAYCASKAAVKSYGEALRGWLAKDNIHVSVICPGFVQSDLSAAFPGDKPFMLSADKAADIIEKGLKRNKANISFPFPLNFGTWLLSIMPAGLADWLLSKMSYGGRR